MLYFNEQVPVTDREMPFGVLSGIAVGERGRGRREIFLPTPKDLTGEVAGMLPGYGIGTTKSGRPRIVRDSSEELYLVLTSEDSYTRRGCGCIRVPAGQTVELIARGNGADGEAGRIGTWDVVVLKANEGDIFRVTWGGYGYGIPSTYYVVHGGQVHVADQPDVEALFDHLGLEVPFSLTWDGESLVADLSEWVDV